MRSPDHGSEYPGAAADGLLDMLPVGVAELDAAGQVLRVNRAMAELFGLDPRDFTGRTVADLGWWPDVTASDGPGSAAVGMTDLLAAAELTRPSGTGGIDHDGSRELRMVNADGRELSLRITASRVRLSDPRVSFVITVFDATRPGPGREAAEEAEGYPDPVDHVEDVVMVHHGELVAWVSPSVRTVLGLDPSALVGRTVSEFAHPDDVALLPALTPEHPRRRHRIRIRHGDGDWRWFSATVSANWDDDGRLDTLHACLRRIDGQLLLEGRKRDAERRMRQAFDASPDGFAIIVAERDEAREVTGLRLQSINRAGAELLELDPEAELGGLDVRSLLPDMEASGLWGRMLAVLEGGGVSRSRTEHNRGGRVHTIDGFQARLDEHSLVLSFRDVSELVEGERLLTVAYEDAAEMRATLQTALDATSDCFAVYALEFDETDELSAMRVVHANAAGAESLGLDPDLMVGMELHEFFPEVAAVGLWDKLVQAARTKAPQYHRVHHLDEDGTWFASWDNTVAPVGEERMTITWRNVSKEESALRQLERTRDEAMYSATHDALTDLPNRVLLRQHLHEALRVCRPDERVGLVFVDLDKFKAVNDTYGHAAGDAVLKATATRLGRLVRHGDLAARLAGDEFVLVLTRLAVDWKPDQFFARANAALTESVMHEDIELHPSASLGVVLADQERLPSDADALIKEADAAMYRNKAARRAAR